MNVQGISHQSVSVWTYQVSISQLKLPTTRLCQTLLGINGKQLFPQRKKKKVPYSFLTEDMLSSSDKSAHTAASWLNPGPVNTASIYKPAVPPSSSSVVFTRRCAAAACRFHIASD